MRYLYLLENERFTPGYLYTLKNGEFEVLKGDFVGKRDWRYGYFYTPDRSKRVLVDYIQGVMHEQSMWFENRDDELARDIFKKYVNDLIAKFEKSLNKYNNLLEKLEEVE